MKHYIKGGIATCLIIIIISLACYFLLRNSSEPMNPTYQELYRNGIFSESVIANINTWGKGKPSKDTIQYFLSALSHSHGRKKTVIADLCNISNYSDYCNSSLEIHSPQGDEMSTIKAITSNDVYTYSHPNDPENQKNYTAYFNLKGKPEPYLVDTGFTGSFLIAGNTKTGKLIIKENIKIYSTEAKDILNNVETNDVFNLPSVETTDGTKYLNTNVIISNKSETNLVGLKFFTRFNTICIGKDTTFNCIPEAMKNSIPFYFNSGGMYAEVIVNSNKIACRIDTGSLKTSIPYNIVSGETESAIINSAYQSKDRQTSIASISHLTYSKSLNVFSLESCFLGMDFYGPHDKIQIDFTTLILSWN
jgi:hypothetical protein